MLAEPLSIFRIWEGGMSFHGGFVGVAIALAIFARKRGKPSSTCSISRCRCPHRLRRGSHRQLHQRRALGQADGRAVGRDRRRHSVAPFAALRGVQRRASTITALGTMRLAQSSPHDEVADATGAEADRGKGMVKNGKRGRLLPCCADARSPPVRSPRRRNRLKRHAAFPDPEDADGSAQPPCRRRASSKSRPPRTRRPRT